MRTIRIKADEIEARAELLDTPTADRIWDSLPFTGRANTWGDEVYFTIPVRCALEKGTSDEMPVGSLAYWTPGSAFCILFGPTPASPGALPCLANPGNRFGRLLGNPRMFKNVKDGCRILVERI